jgi:hypothetical protein
MKYIPALVLCFAFGLGALVSAQNPDLQNKDIAASRRQSTGAATTSRATVGTPVGYGAAKNSKLDRQLGKIERENVKSKSGKPVRHSSTHVAGQDPKNTKPINFGHGHQTRNKGSNKRGKK